MTHCQLLRLAGKNKDNISPEEYDSILDKIEGEVIRCKSDLACYMMISEQLTEKEMLENA
jgi:hypothetical protein